MAPFGQSPTTTAQEAPVTVVETIKHDTAPLVARIVYDEYPESPRDREVNLATLILSHSR